MLVLLVGRQSEWAMGVEPLAPLCLSQGQLPLFEMPPRRNRQRQLTMENPMRLFATTMPMQEVKMTGLGAWRLVEDEVLELDVVERDA